MQPATPVLTPLGVDVPVGVLQPGVVPTGGGCNERRLRKPMAFVKSMSEAFVNVWVLVRVVISIVRRQLVHVALMLRQTSERQQAAGRLRERLGGAHATLACKRSPHSLHAMPALAAAVERIPPLPQPTLHLLQPHATASRYKPGRLLSPTHLQPSGAVIRHPSPRRRLGRKARLAAQGWQVQLNHIDALVRLGHNDVHL